jgi:hypothetical protein
MQFHYLAAQSLRAMVDDVFTVELMQLRLIT